MSSHFTNSGGFSDRSQKAAGENNYAQPRRHIPIEYPEDYATGFAKALKNLFTPPPENQNDDDQNQSPGPAK